MQPTAIDSKSKNHHGERVAFIQACWHKDIVDQSRKGFLAEMIAQGYQESDIDFFEVGGAFELPLHWCWPIWCAFWRWPTGRWKTAWRESAQPA